MGPPLDAAALTIAAGAVDALSARTMQMGSRFSISFAARAAPMLSVRGCGVEHAVAQTCTPGCERSRAAMASAATGSTTIAAAGGQRGRFRITTVVGIQVMADVAALAAASTAEKPRTDAPRERVRERVHRQVGP